MNSGSTSTMPPELIQQICVVGRGSDQDIDCHLNSGAISHAASALADALANLRGSKQSSATVS